MIAQGKPQKFKPTESLIVSIAGKTVGELYKMDGKGIYFVYDKIWLARPHTTMTITQKISPSSAMNLKKKMSQPTGYSPLHTTSLFPKHAANTAPPSAATVNPPEKSLTNYVATINS